VKEYGLFFGASYLVVTFLFVCVYYYLFQLLKNPFIKGAYPEFVASKTTYKWLAGVSISIYLVRSLFFLFLGHYQTLISNLFVKFFLFFALTTLLELPFLFQTYISHMRTLTGFEMHKSFYVKRGTVYAPGPRPSEFVHLAGTQSSRDSVQSNIVLVVALMDIDFVNQYRAAAMSQFSNLDGFDDVESQDEELTLENEDSYKSAKSHPTNMTRPTIAKGNLGHDVPLLESNYQSTKDQSLGKSLGLSRTQVAAANYSINQDPTKAESFFE
jgi:hypothetical protein